MRSVLLACVCACAVAAACAGAPAGPGAEAPDHLYRQKCAACHRPYEPASRTRAQWREALGRMAPKAHLEPAQEAALRRWLEARASDAEAAP